tara:strand:- start:213021 stop:213737 length:717 start_codon:yes stop_codon:yes gene_type:complete
MRSLATILSGVALMVSAAAGAQGSSTEKKEQAQGRKVLTDFARCAADLEPKIAREYILLSPDQRLPEDDWGDLLNPDCMGFHQGRLAMNSFYFRGALAQRLIVKQELQFASDSIANVDALEWRTPGLPAQGALSDEAFAKVRAAFEDYQEKGRTETFVSWVGECIARTSPAGVAAVFETKIDSKSELRALEALTGEIVGCVPEGNEVAIHRTTLRTGLAIAYFRLADAHASAAGGVSS